MLSIILISSFAVTYLKAQNNVFAQESLNVTNVTDILNLDDTSFVDTELNATDIAISVQTDNNKYVVGTPVRVFGSVFSGSGIINDPVPVVIGISEISEGPAYFYDPFDPNAIVPTDFDVPSQTYVTTMARNGSYNVLATLPPEPGIYQVNASTTGSVFKNTANSTVPIEVQELFFTRAFVMSYIGGGIGFFGLTIVILKAPRRSKGKIVDEDKQEPPKGKIVDEDKQERRWGKLSSFFSTPLNHNSFEIFRFLFLSLIAFTAMLSLALTDVQIAPASPLGLVIKTSNNQSNNQWVLNFGGIPSNNYSSGVQVPVSVVIFGIAGGYLRFLYYTSTKRREGLEEEPFYESLKDMSLFFLSPLLAIAVWLVLFQAGTTSIFTLAAVSFTVGLVTREVVDSLIKFVRSKVSTEESDNSKKPT